MTISAKHVVVALLAAATILVTPFALPRSSHLLIDGPQAAQQD
jgi:hypothetical protein